MAPRWRQDVRVDQLLAGRYSRFVASKEKLRSGARDPMIEVLENLPLDDEPTTPEEDAGAREARDEYRRGEAFEAEQITREMA
jgi:hypothetical protein